MINIPMPRRAISKLWRSIKHKICFLLMLFGAQQVCAQSAYEINIDGKHQPLMSGFAKMGTAVSTSGESFSYNSNYLTHNGKPWYPVMGEMHFARVPAKDWEPMLLKMKSCGVNVISTYVFWNYTEQTEGHFNWTGNDNLHQFLALCQKLGLYVWLRPGPWVHAELKYGGFPDWLVNKQLRLRSNDSVYLKYVERFYKAIGQQCNGFWFKQNGPVIGVQIENELDFRKPAAYAHMKTLKAMAIADGMDVPYYSAFGQGPDDQDEFLYMMGSYPDSPWSQTTQKLIKPIYFIKPLEADRDIGADLLGKVDGKVRTRYPRISAEIGGGMQVTYHRRTAVTPADVAANAFTKIASGLNGLGYYMFSGGINPTVAGQPVQESRLTGYPNDLPLFDYDFQAPVSVMQTTGNSYAELRLLNLFLNDFGAQLAETNTVFPGKLKTLATSADTVQSSLREKEGHGFIFLSNYQRNVDQPAVKSFQLAIAEGDAKTQVPLKPTDFPANSYAIWPYHLNLAGDTLNYATAQPLCLLNNKERVDYVFFANGPAEFVFDHLKKNPVAFAHCKLDGNRVITDGSTAKFQLTHTNGQVCNVLVLTREQALRANKISIAGKQLLVLSKGALLQQGNKISLETTQAHETIEVYPAVNIRSASSLLSLEKVSKSPLLHTYQLNAHHQVVGVVDIKQLSAVKDTVAVNHRLDSILAILSYGKNYKQAQHGPLYGIKRMELPGEVLYDVAVKAPTSPLIADWQAVIQYDSDTMGIYAGGQLRYDQFNYNNSCSVRLSNITTNNKFTVQLLPFTSGSDVYVEDNIKNSRDANWKSPAIKHVDLQPVYCYTLLIK